MIAFISGALSVTTQRFLSFELGRKDYERLSLTFSQAVYVHFLLGFLVIVFAETVGMWFLQNKMVIDYTKIAVAQWVYQLSIISLIITFAQAPYMALITAREEMNIYAIIGVVEAVLQLGVAIVIGFISSDRLFWYAIIRLGATLCVSSLYCGYCVLKYKESRLRFQLDKKIFRSLTSFAGWSIFGALAWTGKNQGINIILNMFFSTVVNAAYGIANQVNVAINSFVQNFTVAMNPQIVKSYATGDYDRVSQLIMWGGKIAFMMLFLLAFPVINAIDGILSFWLTEVPEYTASFIRLILVVSLLESFTFAIGTALQATGKIKAYQVIVGLTILANLPLAWICLRQGLQPTSVLVVSVIIAAITLLERIVLLKWHIPGFSVKRYSGRVLLRAITVAIVSVAAYAAVYRIFRCWDLHWIIIVLLSVVIAAVAEYLCGLTHDERQKTNHAIKNLINKIWTK